MREQSDRELWWSLFENFFAGYTDHIVDSAVSIDERIVALREGGHLERMITLVDGVASRTTTDQDVVGTMPGLRDVGLPDGTGERAFLLALQARLHEVRRHPDAVLGARSSAVLRTIKEQRASWWSDESLGDLVAEAVLDANRDAYSRWADDPSASGWQTQHFYADLSDLRDRVGDFGLTAPYASIDRRVVPDPARTEPTTGAVVVVDARFLDGDTSGIGAYPERRLDVRLRSAYPDLCHWFGGFFGQGSVPVLQMRAACRTTQDPARSRVREQLRMLLLEDDDTLERVVDACGSYVLADNVRHWVDRSLWRLDAFPWLGPHGDVLPYDKW